MPRIDEDSFDEVDLDNVGDLKHQYPPHSSSLSYMYKRNNLYMNSTDSFTRSTQCLVNNNSYDNISTTKIAERATEMTKPKPISKDVVKRRPSYSPSKKLKEKREVTKKDLDNLMSIDNTDDELDDSTIIFDVPLSQSLVQLTNHSKPIQPKLLSLSSLSSDASTRNSSLMSYDHSKDNESISEFDNILSNDAKRITYQFSQDEFLLTHQESQLRIHILQNLEKPFQNQTNDGISSDLKQKYINSTRQITLPPKSKKESSRHLRQVSRLKEQAIKLELQIEKNKLKKLNERNAQLKQDLNEWNNDIIPNFTTKIQSPSTRELWWRGIPSQLRKHIWSELLESKSIGEFQLEKLKRDAIELIDKSDPLTIKISKSLAKVFPNLGVFQNALSRPLLQVITMYSIYAKYDEHVVSLAAVLLFNVQDMNKTFLSLIGLLNRNLLKCVYNIQDEIFQEEAQSFLRTFSTKIPSLYSHFESIDISPESYLIPLIKSVFSNILSMEICSHIMDIYVFEGDSILWRCVLGLFDRIGYKLYGNEAEILDVVGWNALAKLNKDNSDWFKYIDVGDEYEFIQTVRQVLKKKVLDV